MPQILYLPQQLSFHQSKLLELQAVCAAWNDFFNSILTKGSYAMPTK
jgi:hypothetical protein